MMLPEALTITRLTNLLIRRRWPWHLGFWLMYAASRAFSYYVTVMDYPREFLEFMLITELSFAVLVYSTIRLYAVFFSRQQFGWYFGLSAVLWVGYLTLVIAFQKYYLRNIPAIAETPALSIFLNATTKYFFTFVLLTMAKYFKDNFIRQYYENQQKQLQMQSELQHLKAQISPHFLFNTMNNFYGLAVQGSDKLPGLMVRLSGLLRYSLYETQNTTVPIGREIAYLRNYVELEKIRLEDNLDFNFESSVSESDTHAIAPLLLVVFVENAFKHAKNVTEDVLRIRIEVSLEEGNTLFFEVLNNCLTPENAPLSETGIGLENVKKRLAALYPDSRHTLQITHEQEVFHVKLMIKLDDR